MTGQKPPVRKRTRPRSYAVGYGKPPVETRFKKGQSGNPRGRPKGTRGLQTIVREMLHEKVTVSIEGNDRRITALEALLLKQMELASKGNLRAFEKLIQLFMAGEPEQTGPNPGPTMAELTETDRSILAEMREMMLTNPTVDSDDPAEVNK